MNDIHKSLIYENPSDINPVILIERKRRRDQTIPDGYCHCGCGEKVNRYKQTRMIKGVIKVKGDFQEFLHGHNSFGENCPNWKGGRQEREDGYNQVAIGKSKQVLEHVYICELVLGKPLPPGAVVHHVNEIKNDNRNSNLVICQDRAYHLLLHKRIRALKQSGHANWEKCVFCKEYDDPANLFHAKYGQQYHRECRRLYQKKQRHDSGFSINYRN
jgi:hypothetical protein